MKYRKTTHEERILIARIQNQLNYKQTAQKYNVSYNLVYQWVKKYQKNMVLMINRQSRETKPENSRQKLSVFVQKWQY